MKKVCSYGLPVILGICRSKKEGRGGGRAISLEARAQPVVLHVQAGIGYVSRFAGWMAGWLGVQLYKVLSRTQLSQSHSTLTLCHPPATWNSAI